MNQSIAVVGAGICGLFTGLSLARKGFDVTLFERDVPPPQGNVEDAFFSWQRRGAAQFRHPHAFLGLMCSVLGENYPDLLEELLAAGARKLTFEERNMDVGGLRGSTFWRRILINGASTLML